MKVLEFMSFNPEWFLTLPGILITGGVILLLIALIILLTSNKKEDKEEESSSSSYGNDNYSYNVDNNLNNNLNNDVNNNLNVESVETLQTNNVNSFESPVDVNTTISSMPQTLNVVNNVPNVNYSANNEVLSPMNAENNVPEVVESVEVPTLNLSSSSQSVESPSIEQVQSYNSFVQEPTSTVVQQPQAPVSVYGGTSPVTSFTNPVEQSKPVIYGGADPLENTAPMPKIESQTLYNQPIVNDVVQSNVTPVIQQPVVNNVMNTVPDISYNNPQTTTSVEKPIINDEIETLEL